MQIGLTGATGVLGRRISAALLARGHSVDALQGDIRNSEIVSDWVGRQQIVIHSAAIVPVKQVNEQLSDAIAVNAGGAANVARAVAATTNCRLVYISTSHVYHASDAPLSEADPARPLSLYGLTKLQGEDWVRLLAPDALIVRVFSFFDSRQPTSYLVPALRRRISEASSSERMMLEGADSIRDIANAAWLADIIARLAETSAIGVVNCGTGEGHRIRDIAEALAHAMGRADLKWQASSAPSNSLVADTRRLIDLLNEVPSFDLQAALAEFAAETSLGSTGSHDASQR
jgi:nucleoside-diphosphate-sugar epimerase